LEEKRGCGFKKLVSSFVYYRRVLAHQQRNGGGYIIWEGGGQEGKSWGGRKGRAEKKSERFLSAFNLAQMKCEQNIILRKGGDEPDERDIKAGVYDRRED